VKLVQHDQQPTETLKFEFLLARPAIMSVFCHTLRHLKVRSCQCYVADISRLRSVVALWTYIKRLATNSRRTHYIFIFIHRKGSRTNSLTNLTKQQTQYVKAVNLRSKLATRFRHKHCKRPDVKQRQTLGMARNSIDNVCCNFRALSSDEKMLEIG